MLLYAVLHGQEKVMRCCMAARHAGVRPGMTVAEARALCPQALRIPFDADASRQGLVRLAAWALRFSPVVALDPDALMPGLPDGLLLDVTGEGHLFGGEHLLLAEIGARLARLGFSTRLAIAPTIGAAWALSRYAPNAATLVNDHHLDAALAPLPVAALRLTPDLSEALDQVGIEQIRHLLKLPRESLMVRFGESLLWRLDQAFGRAAELIEPQRITEPLAVRRVFDGPAIQLEAVMITVQELMTDLCEKLREKESGARGLRVELQRFNAAPASRELVLGRPCRDAKHLWNLLRPKVETMHLGYGVEAVTLTAHWTETIRHQQAGAWGLGNENDLHDEEFAAFLDTLVSRWGKERVLAANPTASYVPECARSFQPAQLSPRRTAESPLLLVDRPSVLLDPPEPSEAIALQPDHAPSWLKWRGREYPLTDGIGPERIATAWWQSEQGGQAVRDYFKVKTRDGAWLWVFRDLVAGRWFVHGIWA